MKQWLGIFVHSLVLSVLQEIPLLLSLHHLIQWYNEITCYDIFILTIVGIYSCP